MIKVSAPGKVHFSGEHSVVYGQPALLTAIDKRCFVSWQERSNNLIEIFDKKIQKKESLTFEKIRYSDAVTENLWRIEDPLGLVKVAISKTYGFLERKPEKGFKLMIDSQIPIGAGLGSSAALSVAVSALLLMANGESFDKTLINEIAYEVEKRQHGKPSGGDNTVVVYGGFLKFVKKDDQFQFEQLNIQKKKLPKFLLVDSGKPVESTGEMVSRVSAKYQIQGFLRNANIKYQKVLKKMGKITNEFVKIFKKEDFSKLKSLILENERLLEKLGVVGKKARKIIDFIEKKGGAAKICGAGGVKEGSGMILVYHPQKEKLIKELKGANLKFMEIELGQEGVGIEKS